jgi:hypothetical protein
VRDNVHTTVLEGYRSPERASSAQGRDYEQGSSSERRAWLLGVVAEGCDGDARPIDLTASARYGPGAGTLLQELEELQRPGLVVRDDSRSGVGGRWKATAAARPHLEHRDDVPD